MLGRLGHGEQVSASTWLVVHLLAAAVLTGVGWVVQLVVYPAFALVGRDEWMEYHARHSSAITRVVAVPWAAQGISTVALLIAPPPGGLLAAAVLAVLALCTVVATVVVAVPAHRRLGEGPDRDGALVTTLLRANVVRALAWTASAALAAALL